MTELVTYESVGDGSVMAVSTRNSLRINCPPEITEITLVGV